ncbi:MAG: hypothetical protein K6C96_03520 [Butyrivibrio sp.]|nr:hypothetical protein [Butyrivibrio sp.]
MLTVILIWMYVIITTYLVGFGFLTSFSGWPGMNRKKAGHVNKTYEFRFRESYLMAGVVLLTVFAQVFSLFTGVGLVANIIVVIACNLILIYYRSEILYDVYQLIHRLRQGGTWIIYLAVFLIMAYGTSHGFMHYDSDLYHAQAIHWIEDYGIIKGLGNLHVRLAYNSAAFPLSALFSMSFLVGQSYHVMAGFFALLLAWQCVDIMNVYRRGHFVISDFARLAAIYYLFTIYDEMMAPASDYFLSTLVFYIIIHWLDMNVRHEKSYVPYILLALLGVFAITVKLSAAPLLLLCIIPVQRLLTDRNKEKMAAFWISVGLAALIVLPFLIRNVVISGWLLYPVTFLNFFGFSWKIPKGVAQFDAKEIRTFGKGYNDVSAYGDVSFAQWVPRWFSQIGGISKVMLIMSIVAALVYIAYLIYFVVVVAGQKVQTMQKSEKPKVFEISRRSMMNMEDFFTIGGTLLGCLLFWFFSAPLIRYGVVYIWLVPAVILGRMFIILFNRFGDNIKSLFMKTLTALFFMWMIYKGVNLVLEDAARFDPRYLVEQQDYGTYSTDTFELGGITFYYPTEGDRVGYYPFPAATHDLTGEVELMGKELKNGFTTVTN